MLRIEKEVPTWHGPVSVSLEATDDAGELVITARLRPNGKNKLVRGLWIASRALFLAALDLMPEEDESSAKLS